MMAMPIPGGLVGEYPAMSIDLNLILNGKTCEILTVFSQHSLIVK